MPVSDSAIDAAIDLIAAVPGLEMDPDDLADDVVLLSVALPEEADFLKAVASTERALRQLVGQTVDSAPLAHNLAGWLSYHYQHTRKQGQRANMRIVFQRVGEGIRVRAFGHRDVPSDFYERIVHSRPGGTGGKEDDAHK